MRRDDPAEFLPGTARPDAKHAGNPADRRGLHGSVPKGDLDSVGVASFGRDRSVVRRKLLEAILNGLRNGGSLEGYTQALYEAVHADFIYARWIAELFYRFPGFFFDLWVRSSSGLDLIGQVLYGEIRYRDLFYKAVRALMRPKSYQRLLSGLRPA